MGKKVALHIIMPNQVSGPNSASRRIASSWLNKKYEFDFVTQEFHAGSKINFKLINAMKKQVKDMKPDLIHLTGMQASGFHAVVAARLAGYKNILITIRGFSGDAIGLNPLKRFAFNCFIEPITLALCKNFFTVCSQAGEKAMVKKYKKKYLGVIHNAAPNVNFDVDTTRIEQREKFGFSKEDFVVVVSGRMVYDKGLSYIMEAIKQIDSSHIKFLFIGDGPYCDIMNRELADEVAKKRVIILGKQDEVMKLLTAADVFLFATLHENLSNALLEAMAVGLPVIATQIGGNVEVVEKNANGFLIKDESADDIVKYVELLSQNKDLCEKFARRSKEIVREKFSQELLYSKISQIYDSMLEKE